MPDVVLTSQSIYDSHEAEAPEPLPPLPFYGGAQGRPFALRIKKRWYNHRYHMFPFKISLSPYENLVNKAKTSKKIRVLFLPTMRKLKG